MSQWEKLYKKIRNNPRNVKFEEIDRLLRHAGFVRRQSNSGGSHYSYSHEQLSEILTIPKNKPVKAFYIKLALTFYEQVVGE